MVDLDSELADLGQRVLVLQGGGALGAYQAGVYEALCDAGVAPDWVIGTSIGAINAAIIAGSRPSDRLPALREFWRRMERGVLPSASLPGWLSGMARNWTTVWTGLPGFFEPMPLAFMSPHMPLGADHAGYYSTAPLERTLNELIDFNQLNHGGVRLTVGASRIRSSEMVYFDSRDMTITPKHIMASGALPPAFPAVRIDGDLYWDGGILSNTPVEAVFDDRPRRNGIIFAVHLWSPHGHDPVNIWEVMNRQKDLQYSSRAHTHIKRQRQIHKLRHIVAKLSEMLPEDARHTPEVREMAAYGCTTTMHVVRLLAPMIEGEDHSKDIDFSREGIAKRWDAGKRDTMAVLEQAPWRGEHDPLEGFLLHEARAGEMMPKPQPGS